VQFAGGDFRPRDHKAWHENWPSQVRKNKKNPIQCKSAVTEFSKRCFSATTVAL